jgi:hypothetical protein
MAENIETRAATLQGNALDETGILSWLHFGDLHITEQHEENYRDFLALIITPTRISPALSISRCCRAIMRRRGQRTSIASCGAPSISSEFPSSSFRAITMSTPAASTCYAAIALRQERTFG